jgi:uncharacterized protein
MTSSASSKPVAMVGSAPIRAMLPPPLDRDNPQSVALVYLVLLALAESLTALVAAQLGAILHFTLLFVIMLHAGLRWDRRLHRLLLTLTAVPLIRIISLSLPLLGFQLQYWYLITSIPLFIAAFVMMRLLDLSWVDVGVRFGGRSALFQQLLIGLSGVGLGYVEYLILRPEPLVETFTLRAIWLPALILLISTGFLEELIFRGLMQYESVNQLGQRWGIVYIALFFAVLHIGYESVLDVLFVLVVGLAFGWLVNRTGSILGVTVAHGLTNIVLYLVIPFFVTGPQLPFEPPQETLASLQMLADATEPLGANTRALGRASVPVASPTLPTGMNSLDDDTLLPNAGRVSTAQLPAARGSVVRKQKAPWLREPRRQKVFCLGMLLKNLNDLHQCDKREAGQQWPDSYV